MLLFSSSLFCDGSELPFLGFGAAELLRQPSYTCALRDVNAVIPLFTHDLSQGWGVKQQERGSWGLASAGHTCRRPRGRAGPLDPERGWGQPAWLWKPHTHRKTSSHFRSCPAVRGSYADAGGCSGLSGVTLAQV